MISSVSKITASGLFIALLFCLLCGPGPSRSSVVSTSTVRRSILERMLMEEHQFIPALNDKLHYVGRWLPTANRLRWDAAFPGAYIDLIVRNASIIYISLNNAPSPGTIEWDHDQAPVQRMNFRPSVDREKAATPITLTITVCDGTFIHFASSGNGLLAVNLHMRTDYNDCSIRVSHAGGPSQDGGVLQFKGIWLPVCASLQHVASAEDEEAAGSDTAAKLSPELPTSYRKTVEILTDSSNHVFAGGVAQIVDWPTQVAAHFDVDWVKIPAHNHCLTEECTNMMWSDVSTQDLFFRSGPADTSLLSRPWGFEQYIPEVLILDLGTIDHKSFLQPSRHDGESPVELRVVHQSLESFTNTFINTYMAFIQQIRRAAYPLHPSAFHRYALDGDGYTYNSAPSTLPIFIMRPLDGSLAQATLSVVEQMQKEGDKSVFWIDTSGWLSETDYTSNTTNRQAPGLTARGHAKVASFMDAHLCHYLAPQPDECPFLRRDNYMGNVYVPIEAELDKVNEESKIKKLTELFWGKQMTDQGN